MNLAIDLFNEERFGLVTGSRCSPLVPIRDAKKGIRSLAFELAKESVFKFYDEVSSWQMEHGTMNEAFAKQHYIDYYDNSLQDGFWKKKGDIGGNNDAHTDEYGVDFKCPTTLNNWLSCLIDPIKKEYYDQCQLYMMVFDKPKWLLCHYLTETQKMNDFGLVYPIEESKRMIVQEILPDDEWRKKFEKNLPELVRMRDEFIDVLRLQLKLI